MAVARPPAPPTLRDTAAALRASVADVTALLRSGIDPGRVAVGTWTSADVAAHLANSLEMHAAQVKREPAPTLAVDDIARHNDEVLARDPERDPRALADRIDAIAADLFDHLGHVPDRDEISWLGLIDLPVASLVAIQIGEFLVHGHDLAAAAERRLRIAPGRARLALNGLLPLVSLYVDRRAARGFSAAFDIRVRGGVRFDLVFDDGEARIEEPTARRIDCRISADPVAYLLVSYGRMAPTTPALTGKIVAWGRKPWLGFKLPTLLRRP